MVYEGATQFRFGRGECGMSSDATIGFRDPSTAATQSAVLDFLIRQQLAKLRTSTIVQVLSVTNNGGVSPVGTVDIQPLVNQTDGAGNVTALPPVYGVPYLRVQGGTDAIILDPKIGDLGIALFGDRDLSAVIATKKAAAPGSARRNSLSDALYIGGILNGTPTQYVQFSSAGIELLSPTKVTIHAPTVAVEGNMTVTGTVVTQSTITASGDVTGSGTSLHTHIHSGVQSGTSNTGQPV